MARERILTMCHLGGEVVFNSDGSMSYAGEEEAHAIEITREMKFSDFKSEISSMFNSNMDAFTIKYFLPIYKEGLITVSDDIDLKFMVDHLCADSGTTDVYVLKQNRTMIRSAPDDSGAPTRVTKRQRLSIAARERIASWECMIMLRSVRMSLIHERRISGSDKGGQPADQQG